MCSCLIQYICLCISRSTFHRRHKIVAYSEYCWQNIIQTLMATIIIIYIRHTCDLLPKMHSHQHYLLRLDSGHPAFYSKFQISNKCNVHVSIIHCRRQYLCIVRRCYHNKGAPEVHREIHGTTPSITTPSMWLNEAVEMIGDSSEF